MYRGGVQLSAITMFIVLLKINLHNVWIVIYNGSPRMVSTQSKSSDYHIYQQKLIKT